MKRIIRPMWQTALVAIAALSLFACSSREQDVREKLDSVVNDSTKMVVTADISRLFDALDVVEKKGKLELPEYLRATVNKFCDEKARQGINNILDKAEGIGYDNAVLAVSDDVTGELTGVFVFTVTDKSDFVGSLKTLADKVNTDNAGSYEAVKAGDIQVLMTDEQGFIVFDSRKPLWGAEAAALLDKWREKARKLPLADWKADRLTERHVGNLLVSNRWYTDIIRRFDAGTDLQAGDEKYRRAVNNGNTFLSFDMTGQSVSLSTVTLDTEGAVIEIPYTGKFDTELMAYASPDDFLAISMSMNADGYKTLSEAINNAMSQLSEMYKTGMAEDVTASYAPVIDGIASLPQEYLTDGGIFASFGFAEGLTLGKADFTSPQAYHLVIAADIQPEKVTKAYNSLCDQIALMCQTNDDLTINRDPSGKCKVTIRYGEDYDHLSDKWIYSTVDVNIERHDNRIVISNAPIKKNNTNVFAKEVFDGTIFAGQLVVSAQTPIVKELGFKEGLTASISSRNTTDIELTVTGTDSKFVPAVMSFLTGVNN